MFLLKICVDSLKSTDNLWAFLFNKNCTPRSKTLRTSLTKALSAVSTGQIGPVKRTTGPVKRVFLSLNYSRLPPELKASCHHEIFVWSFFSGYIKGSINGPLPASSSIIGFRQPLTRSSPSKKLNKTSRFY